MKRFGTVTIAMTLGLGLALTGFSTSASAASNCPVQPNFQYQYQVVPFMPQMQMQPIQAGTPMNQLYMPQQPVAAPKQQAPTPAPAQTPVNNQAQPAGQNTQVQASDFAKKVTDLVNQERAKAGLKPVQMDAALSNVALAKAADMSNNNYFDHTSPTYGSPFDMMKKYGISFMTAGENIAMGQRSPEEVMNQWMNSEGHRQNIMNPAFTKIGVGFTNGYWVQEFIG